MTRIFEHGNIKISVTDDNSEIQMTSPKKTKPIQIKTEDLASFSAELFAKLSKIGAVTLDEAELNNVIGKFTDFLFGKNVDVEISLDVEPEQPTEKTTPEIIIPEQEKKEKPTSGIDATKLIERYNELKKTNDPLKATELTAKEFNITQEMLQQIIPVTAIEIDANKMQPSTLPIVIPKEEAGQPKSQQEFNIASLPGYDYLTATHLEWAKTLANKVYNITVEALLKMYVKKAEKIPIRSNTLWITLLFNDAQAHNLFNLVQDRVRHITFYYRSNGDEQSLEVLGDRNLENLAINRCYNIPECNVQARLIAMTYPPSLRDVSTYPKTMKKITKLESIGDLPAIPLAHKVFLPISIKDAMKQAKEAPNKEIIETVYGSIKGRNDWKKGSGAFIAICDGSDTEMSPTGSCKIALAYDNPFGIDEKIIAAGNEKLVLCYGYITYTPQIGNFKENLMISPMYLVFVE